MNLEMSFTTIAPPVFDGINYQVWAEAYLDANNLQEAVEQVYEVSIMSDNPTITQIKNHREKRKRTLKAKATLFAIVSPIIFYRIMTLNTANEIWDFLKRKYEENERIKWIQVLNLIREFEL